MAKSAKDHGCEGYECYGVGDEPGWWWVCEPGDCVEGWVEWWEEVDFR